MNNEQRALHVLRTLAVDIGEPDDDGEMTVTSMQIVSREDEHIPIAAACVVATHGPRIMLADTDGGVVISPHGARKVAAYLLAHAQDGPPPQGMRRVRIAVGITRDGYWYAMAHGAPQGNSSDEVFVDEVRDGLAIETDEPVTIHWIEADIPLPANQAIRAYPLPDEGE